MKRTIAFLLAFLLTQTPSALAAQPVALYDAKGNPITSTTSGGKTYLDVSATLSEAATEANGGAGLPALLKIIGGYDGTNVRVISTDNTGAINVNASNPSVSSTGAAVPAKATYIAGSKAGTETGLLLGQQTMANSLACVLPSDQSAIPVTGTFWQATQPVSGTFWQATQPVSGTFWQATQPVSAASLPLPTGASTSALQTTGNTALTTINTTLGSPFQAGGALGAGAAIIGKVGIDQTTPGTTNGVQVNAALPVGANVIGKVSIDQTTPGTTNLVSIGTNGTVQTKAPLNSTGSGSAAAATVSTVITLTAPANAVKAYLMNLDTSTANIRWAVNRTATTTLGQQLQPGRDVVIDTTHDISLVSESGTQNYDVQWISQ